MASRMAATPYDTPLPLSPPLSPSVMHPSLPTIATHLEGPDTPARSSDSDSSMYTTASLDVAPPVKAKIRRAITSPDGTELKQEKKRGDGNKAMARLEDFRLIHVLGKGCAGRVGFSYSADFRR